MTFPWLLPSPFPLVVGATVVVVLSFGFLALMTEKGTVLGMMSERNSRLSCLETALAEGVLDWWDAGIMKGLIGDLREWNPEYGF